VSELGFDEAITRKITKDNAVRLLSLDA